MRHAARSAIAAAQHWHAHGARQFEAALVAGDDLFQPPDGGLVPAHLIGPLDLDLDRGEGRHPGDLAVAHLGGNYGLKQFLETDGGYDPSDNKKNPEQGTRLSDYLQKHGGLNVYSDESLSEDAKEELVMSQPVAPRNPIYSDPDYSNPINYMRPVARPTDLAPVFQNELNESPRPVARPQQKAKLQEKYSPEGIEQLLIGTTAEPLLPRQFQRG